MGPLRSSDDKHLLAIELSEKLFDSIRKANDAKRLMFKVKHFQGAPEDPEEQDMLLLLNQKVAENPSYPVPDGYRKVQELVIEDSYQIPEALGIHEAEKISMELLDEVVSSALGIHILRSVPVTRTVTSVVPDQRKRLLEYAATNNIRSHSRGSTAIDADQSGPTAFVSSLGKNLKGLKRSKKDSREGSPESKVGHTSTPQILSKKGK